MTTNEQIRQLVDERDFLLSRLTLKNDTTWVSPASDAMITQAIIGAKEPIHWPNNQTDLERCEETVRRAPLHLQRAMKLTLERFRCYTEQRRQPSTPTPPS